MHLLQSTTLDVSSVPTSKVTHDGTMIRDPEVFGNACYGFVPYIPYLKAHNVKITSHVRVLTRYLALILYVRKQGKCIVKVNKSFRLFINDAVKC
jgi:hypothetical protein